MVLVSFIMFHSSSSPKRKICIKILRVRELIGIDCIKKVRVRELIGIDCIKILRVRELIGIDCIKDT